MVDNLMMSNGHNCTLTFVSKVQIQTPNNKSLCWKTWAEALCPTCLVTLQTHGKVMATGSSHLFFSKHGRLLARLLSPTWIRDWLIGWDTMENIMFTSEPFVSDSVIYVHVTACRQPRRLNQKAGWSSLTQHPTSIQLIPCSTMFPCHANCMIPPSCCDLSHSCGVWWLTSTIMCGCRPSTVGTQYTAPLIKLSCWASMTFGYQFLETCRFLAKVHSP